MLTCAFCGRSIAGTNLMLVPNLTDPNNPRYYHTIQDEHGNATPEGIASCYLKSAEGKLTLEEYAAERYDHVGQ